MRHRLLRHLARPRWTGSLASALAFGALLVGAVALGQTRRPSMIGVEEIRPGMRGYGLTVFRGTEPERFDVEVIDVLENFRPDQDLILIRTDHPILDSAHVVAGMSGSPIYLDDRLAGAYAYGWPFSSDPVAGVTPIRNMLAELRRPIQLDLFPGVRPIGASAPVARAAPRVDLGGLPAYRGGAVHAESALEAHASRLGIDPTRPRSSATLTPAATPLLVGGMDDGVVAALESSLGRFGLMVLQAGGAGPAQTPAGAPTRYAHGSAVGVQLVRGDIAATAVGTVTHLEGDRVVAFGHPMVNAGQSGLPTAIARVLHVLSSASRSFKISEPVRTLGTLVHDRQSGIVLDTGLEAAGVEAVVRIHGVDEAPRTEWRFTVASHRVLTPVILGAAINNAVSATASDTTDVMYEATSRVWIEGRPQPEEVVDRGYSSAGANPAALQRLRLFALLEATYGNPFERARATRVEVDIGVRFARETLRIVDASVASDEVDPGSTVPVRVVVRRWDEREEVRMVRVAIPDRLRGERVEVTIEGGSDADIEHPIAQSLDDVLRAVHERYPSTSMVVSLKTPSRGLRFGGHVARHLPASALDSLQLRHDGDRNRPFVTYDRRELPVGAVVSGSARIELAVRRRPRP